MRNFEIERKFLIKPFDYNVIPNYKDIPQYDIMQIYLINKDKNTEERVRVIRQVNGAVIYNHCNMYHTIKRKVSTGIREENEVQIDSDKFASYLMRMNPQSRPIIKHRICYPYSYHYIEIDTYKSIDMPGLILEVELNKIEENVSLPDYIEVIKEVTNDDRYSNHSLAFKNLDIN